MSFPKDVDSYCCRMRLVVQTDDLWSARGIILEGAVVTTRMVSREKTRELRF
jgi:hypothetical protein